MKAFTFFLAVFFPVCAVAGPFGIGQGDALSTYSYSEKDHPFKYRLVSVPSPHPIFVEYTVWSTQETGICAVIAKSKVHEYDRYGKNVRSQFWRIKESLDKKYGEGEQYDDFASDGIYDGPREWVMSVFQNERMYGAHWLDRETNTIEFKNIELIQMLVTALGPSESRLKLTYQFQNVDRCLEIFEERARSSL